MYVKAEEMFFKILSEMTNSMPSETTNKCMIVFIEIQEHTNFIFYVLFLR